MWNAFLKTSKTRMRASFLAPPWPIAKMHSVKLFESQSVSVAYTVTVSPTAVPDLLHLGPRLFAKHSLCHEASRFIKSLPFANMAVIVILGRRRVSKRHNFTLLHARMAKINRGSLRYYRRKFIKDTNVSLLSPLIEGRLVSE